MRNSNRKGLVCVFISVLGIARLEINCFNLSIDPGLKKELKNANDVNRTYYGVFEIQIYYDLLNTLYANTLIIPLFPANINKYLTTSSLQVYANNYM